MGNKSRIGRKMKWYLDKLVRGTMSSSRNNWAVMQPTPVRTVENGVDENGKTLYKYEDGAKLLHASSKAGTLRNKPHPSVGMVINKERQYWQPKPKTA